MDLFSEKNWSKNCNNAINFESNYNNRKNPQESTKKSNKKTKTKILNGSIEKSNPSKGKKLMKKNKNEIIKNVKQLNNSDNNSKFEDKLRDTLKGSRFRFLNEQLYSVDSSSAKDLFENDPEAFEAYHVGYRNQVKQWPLNPLDRIIKIVKKMPLHYTIADFGCGEGRLSQSVPHKVYSIDLISSRDDIINCDMANTPLNSESIDVAVYCLSLMGTNLVDFLLEANRVLHPNGLLHIAEIASRFDNFNKFIKIVKSIGFELVRKDVSDKLFYFFVFKKIKNIRKDDVRIQYSLKPCLYKKR